MAEPDLLPASPPSVPDIIQRYLNGETLKDLARENQKHHRTLYRWMLAEVGPAYEHLITELLTNRIADADLEMELASDPCSLARARERMRFSRMDFERRRPKLYGPKTETSTDTKLTVIVQRDTQQVEQATVIEGTVQESPAQPVEIPQDAQE